MATLLDYHACHSPSFHSTNSYNLLISYAMRCGYYNMAEMLFKRMQLNGFHSNMETRKLHVRWLVQRGYWEEAYDHALNGKPTTQLLSLPLWIELTSPSPKTHRDTHLRVLPDIGDEQDSPPSKEDRLWLLLQKAPRSRGGDQIHPGATRYIVQAFLRLGKTELAWKLAASYLSNLPRNLTDRILRRSMAIIHSFLRPVPSEQRGLLQFQDKRRTLMSLLVLHSRLHPSADTLFFLIGNLRGTLNASVHSIRLLESWKRRWGDQVEDDLVRRRIGSYALQDGHHDILKRMARRHKRAGLMQGWTERQRRTTTQKGLQRPPQPVVKRRGQVYRFKRLIWRWRLKKQRQRRTLPTSSLKVG